MLRIWTYLVYFIVFLFLFAVPRKTSASELFFDDFSDGLIGDWQIVQNIQWENHFLPCLNQGVPAQWEIVLQQLGIEISGPPCFTEIVPLFFRLPEGVGYVYEFDMQLPVSTAMDRNYTVQYVDNANVYAMKVLGNQFFVEKLVGARGWSVPGGSTYYDFQPNRTYHFRNEIDVEQHHIRIFINGELILDFDDPLPHLSGGTIGFRASVGSIPYSVSWFDNVRVSTLNQQDITELEVPYLSQRNPQWKDQLYNHANNWSNSLATIERWGCALLSATMILQYHGIEEIASGVQVTPDSLNAWLKEQPDGYIGDGYLNWLAISRLSHEYAMKSGVTPTLEYHFGSNDPELVAEELSEGNPVILALPGHFVVARGVGSDDSIQIHDPFFETRTSLSAYGDTFMSSRLYTPSNTDLSYLMIPVGYSMDLQISGPSDVVEYTEMPYIDHISAEEGQQPLKVILLETPMLGTYTLTIASEEPSQFSVPIYSYDMNGNVEIISIEGVSDEHPQEFRLQYLDNTIISVERINYASSFLEMLQRLRVHGEIRSAFAYYTLETVARHLETFYDTEDARDRYEMLIENKLRFLSAGMSEMAKNLLLSAI